MSIETAIANLQTKALSLSGMKSAPSAPPEANVSFPFAVSYERTGTFISHASGFGDELVTIFTEIHVSRIMLQTAVAQAMAFRDPFIKLLMADPTLAGTVSTINDIRWTFRGSCLGRRGDNWISYRDRRKSDIDRLGGEYAEIYRRWAMAARHSSQGFG